MTRPVIFLGPSLPLPEARALIDADFRPPAGQGDVMRALADAPVAIGLIDGIFKDAPTVRHRELLWALSRGVPVLGAASMGALRAAELAGHGMIGVGMIYRWYRRYPVLPDDAVAVTHTPRALGAQPLSDAMIDIRRSLRAAERAGAISPQQARSLMAHQAALPFPRRHLPGIAGPHRIAQKSCDARALLQMMARHAATGHWPRPATPAPPIVHAWLDDLHDSGLPPPN
jgi:hypothetical protein